MTTRPEGRVVFLQMKLCWRKSEKRADRVVRPYMVRRKIGGTSGQSRPPLHGAAENRRNGRTGASAPTWCGGKSEKRADRVVRPYMVRRKIGGTGGQGRPPLRVRRKIGGTGGQSRPPLRVRRKIVGTGGQSRPPLQGAEEDRRSGRTGSSAPTGCGEGFFTENS